LVFGRGSFFQSENDAGMHLHRRSVFIHLCGMGAAMKQRLIIIITDDEIHLSDASVQLIETMDDMEALDLLRDCNKLLTEIYADIREAYYSAGYEITVDEGETRH
jgi:hypothetical protein